MPHISIREVSYNFENQQNLFKNITLRINSKEKIAIIGDNGVGKSTLFNIVLGNLKPSKGTVDVSGKIETVEQQVQLTGTISKALNIAQKLEALKLLDSGEYSEDILNIIDEDWDIKQRAEKLLEKFNLPYLGLQDSVENLSGGEKVKLCLIKALLSKADFLLLDEPTNNLDLQTKEQFYELISEFKGGILLISHDRVLLNKMNKIAEFKKDSMRVFGGNYDFYKDIKQKELEAMIKKQSSLESQKRDIQKKIEKKEQELSKSKAYVRKCFDNKKYDPKGASFKQVAGAADAATQKATNKEKEKKEEISKESNELKNKIKQDVIKIPLKDKACFKSDLLVIKSLSFNYGKRVLFENFSLHLSSSDRLHIKGNNGSGKSTLIRLIMQDLTPLKGDVKLHGRAVYLNQDLSLLNKQKSLLDNFLDLNYGCSLNDGYKVMANFLFKNVQTGKKVEFLSGGELVKATLACVLGTNNQPDLLILDEPTNNMDIKSIQMLESALKQYKGALIIISHDDPFVKNIGISKTIEL